MNGNRFGITVYKYGPPEPRQPLFRPMVIKYGPPEPQIVDKYAPFVPGKPKAKPEGARQKEIESVLKQTSKCLKKINGLLDGIQLFLAVGEKGSTGLLTDSLGRSLAELSLLYLKLNDLQKSPARPTKKRKSK